METDWRKEFIKAKQDYDSDSPGQFLSRPTVRAIIWEKSQGRCWYCGKEVNPFSEFCIDHFLAIDNGGDESYDNLVPCCRSCNSRKRHYPIENLRSKLAQLESEYPCFTKNQKEWLKRQGVEIQEPTYTFYFEMADNKNEQSPDR